MEDYLEILQSITKKEASELTDYEVEFLRARSSYLSEEERIKFADVLEVKEEIKPKRGRKIS